MQGEPPAILHPPKSLPSSKGPRGGPIPLAGTEFLVSPPPPTTTPGEGPVPSLAPTSQALTNGDT